MIRQNNTQDDFDKLKYGSVISYPSGHKHVYHDFLVLGKTDKTITTVPLLEKDKHKQNRYDVNLPESANKHLDGDYFTSTLNVATISKAVYEQVNPVNITKLSNDDTMKIDQITGKNITSARKAYHSWLGIEKSNMPIAKKHQMLRRGFNKHTLLTDQDVQKFLVGKQFTGKTSNKLYHVAAYIDQEYRGSIAKQETAEEQPFCYKYADVDKLRKYDIVRYFAITGRKGKWRPFLVTGNNGKSVDLIPITHTKHTELNVVSGNGIYSIYHQSLSPRISQALSLLNGDGREKAAKAEDNLAPCQQVSVDLDEFKENQLPQYLGNLTNYVSKSELQKMDNDKDELINQLYTSCEKYDAEVKAFGHVRNYQLKLYNRESISPKDLKQILDHRSYGAYEGENNMHPIISKRYCNAKRFGAIKYGVYQTGKVPNRQKDRHKQARNKTKEDNEIEM